jgi:hypothetical protein
VIPDYYDPEVDRKYATFIQLFWMCIDNKGVYSHLPSEGGALGQPYKTISVLNVMRDVFIKKINDEMKESQNKARR